MIGKSERNQFSGSSKLSYTLPGPGQYSHANTVGAGPSWGFGSERRGRSKSKDIPGPGSYDLPVTIANVPSYAKS